MRVNKKIHMLLPACTMTMGEADSFFCAVELVYVIQLPLLLASQSLQHITAQHVKKDVGLQ